MTSPASPATGSSAPGATATDTDTPGATGGEPASVGPSQPTAEPGGPSGVAPDPGPADPGSGGQPGPGGAPAPPEPEPDPSFSVSLAIRADTILSHLDQFNPDKAGLVPANGWIYWSGAVTVWPGESVYDLLARETRNNGIHMESSWSPLYNSRYVEGINNLYEFDCGELSGWMYKVNGWFPNYGASAYQLSAGDSVEWVYTCDLGRDIGAGGWN